MSRDVRIVVEHRGGEIHPISFELVTLGREVAAITGGRFSAVILGDGRTVEGLAKRFAAEAQVDVQGLRSEHLEPYLAEAQQAALAPLVAGREGGALLIPHTALGTDYAPGLAVRAGAYAVSGAIDVVPSATGGHPEFVRPILNGKLLTRMRPAGNRAVVATVLAGTRPGTGAAGATGAAGRIEVRDVAIERPRSRAGRRIEAPPREVDLAAAEVVVAAGRGIGSREGLRAIEKVAACFDRAAVGGSRTVCDRGWLPIARQIGQTGQTVAPKLYLACGISGAIQHLAGMSHSGFIVAINTDRHAQIFSAAHCGVVADLHAFLPVLVRKLEDRRGGFRA